MEFVVARTLKGGSVGSVNKLRKKLKKGGGGGQYLSRIPSESSLVVRFLTEPDEWVEYYEHYDENSDPRYYPCSDDCKGCDAGDKSSQRYLANALDIDENKVVPLVLPKTVASSILKKYDKFKTLLDRDYELSRTGTGMDTEYDAIPESPTRMNLRRFEALDLWGLLMSQLDSADEDDDEDDDDDFEEKPTRRRSRPTSPASRQMSKRRDDDDEDDDDEPRVRRRRRDAAPAKKTTSRSTRNTSSARKPAKRTMSKTPSKKPARRSLNKR
jgi:hypothetical protein